MRRSRWMFVSMIAVAAPVGAQSAKPPACDQGMAHFRSREWRDAAMELANCEAASPGQTDAPLFRGKALINLGQYDEAAEALTNYVAKHPTSDDGFYTLGYVQFRQDRPRDSLATYTRAAALKAPTDDDLKVVSLDYVLLHDYKDAARYLEQALKMNPENVEARYHLGRVRYQLNQFDLSIAAFEEVLRREPMNLKAEYNLGLSFEGKNQVEDAIRCYKKAIELERNSLTQDEQPYLDLGALLSRSNRASEALPFLQRAAEIKPDSGKAQYELAKAQLGADRAPDAKLAAEKAVQLEPNEGSYHYLLGRVYAKLGDSAMAAEQFKVTDELLKNKGASPALQPASPRSR